MSIDSTTLEDTLVGYFLACQGHACASQSLQAASRMAGRGVPSLPAFYSIAVMSQGENEQGQNKIT